MKQVDTLKDLQKTIHQVCPMLAKPSIHFNQLHLVVKADQWLGVAEALRDDVRTQFNQLIELCGVDFLTYGMTEWETQARTEQGYSRGVSAATGPRPNKSPISVRFSVDIQLLSTIHNHRLSVRVLAEGDEPPAVPSVCGIWPSANWFEREAFDLFGILFEGHPDLRRILTDYGFVGHPFRKDFPLTGKVELRYDCTHQRCVYQPCEVEMRTTVPRVIRPQVTPPSTSEEG